MSLINVKNFLAPLQNRYQIGALLALGLLVGVVRAIGSGDPSPQRENLKVTEDIKQFLASQQPATQAQRDRPGSRAPTDDELLGGLVADGWEDGEVQRREKVVAPADSGSAKRLSDIKRSLGLE